jgi:hypothetical protein
MKQKTKNPRNNSSNGNIFTSDFHFGETPEMAAKRKLAELEKFFKINVISEIKKRIADKKIKTGIRYQVLTTYQIIEELYDIPKQQEYFDNFQKCGELSFNTLRYYYGMEYFYAKRVWNSIRNNPYRDDDYPGYLGNGKLPDNFYKLITDNTAPGFYEDMRKCYGINNYNLLMRTEILTIIDELENFWKTSKKEYQLELRRKNYQRRKQRALLNKNKTHDDLFEVDLWV